MLGKQQIRTDRNEGQLWRLLFLLFESLHQELAENAGTEECLGLFMGKIRLLLSCTLFNAAVLQLYEMNGCAKI